MPATVLISLQPIISNLFLYFLTLIFESTPSYRVKKIEKKSK